MRPRAGARKPLLVRYAHIESLPRRGQLCCLSMTVRTAIRLLRDTAAAVLGQRRRRYRGGAAAILLLTCAGPIAACGGSATSATAALSPGPSSPPSASATAVPVPSPSARATAAPASAPPSVTTETVTDQANGQTIDLQQGQVLQVVLSSTYWMIHGSSDSAVLSLLSGPDPQPQRSGCVSGQGCGTVTVAYRAVAAGHAQVSASRSVCGEALGCTAANSQFVVYVIVK
jgi:hypothetical protein